MNSDKVQAEDGVAVLAVEEHDCANLWKTVEPLLAQGIRGLVLDLSRVDYLSSMNIAAIISLRNKVHALGGHVVVAELRDQIASIFRVLKLERIFELKHDRAAAIAAARAGGR